MHRQTPVISEIDAQTNILNFISNQRDETIEWIYNSNPDVFFAGDNARIFTSRARELKKTNILSILDIISSQYAAEKIKLAQWNKLVTFSISLGRYYAEYKEFSAAKCMLEYALFYLQKISVSESEKAAFVAKKLEIEIELAHYCIEYFKPLKIFDTDITLKELNVAKKSLQQILAVLIKINSQVNNQHDILEYRFLYSYIHQRIGEYFCTEALSLANQLNEENSIEEKRAIYLLIDNKYRDALIYFRHAKQALLQQEHNRSGLLEELATGIQKASDARESFAQQAGVSPNDAADLQYLKNMLYTIVSDRNNGVEVLEKFLEDYQISEEDFEDINILKQNQEEPTIVECIVESGNIEVLTYVLQSYGVSFSLLPTLYRKGLVNSFCEFTLPEVEEYVLDHNYYQNHPQYRIIRFYLAAMTGDLKRIETHLHQYPHDIINIPTSNLADEDADETFVLHTAYQCSKAHVIRYLERYINHYVMSITEYKMTENLRTLYRKMMKCYFEFGWNEKKRTAVNSIAEHYITISAQQLEPFQNIPAQDLPQEYLLFIASVKFEILDIRYEMAVRAEVEGDQNPKRALQLYNIANGIFQKIMTGLTQIDNSLLSQINGAENIIKNMRDAAERVTLKLNSLMQPATLANNAVNQTGGDEKMTVENPHASLTNHPPGSFETSSNMFPHVNDLSRAMLSLQLDQNQVVMGDDRKEQTAGLR